ncbi:MAG: M48 family metallopeptidase [Phycisphaerae bacterium]
MTKNTKLALAAICSCWLAVGCSSAPGGRPQLMLVPEEEEMKLGAEAYTEILSGETIASDARLNEIVQRVGRRIAAQADRPDFEWEFKLIESPQVNAFCLPGGKIAVYTGILPIMKNEAGMAAVMGHEVAHAVARHGGERMSQHMTVLAVSEFVDKSLSGSSKTTHDAAMAAIGLGAQFGVLLPYSRTHELESDELGLFFAARAGYDPTESVRVWERMAAMNQDKPFEFFSTHPAEQRRIDELNDLMEDAMDEYEDAPTNYGLGEDL